MTHVDDRKLWRESLDFARDQGFQYAMRVLEFSHGRDSAGYQALLYRWLGDNPPEFQGSPK